MNRYDIALGKKPSDGIIEKVRLKKTEEFNKIITQTPQVPAYNPNAFYFNYANYNQTPRVINQS
jgi:hypothetical protein